MVFMWQLLVNNFHTNEQGVIIYIFGLVDSLLNNIYCKHIQVAQKNKDHGLMEGLAKCQFTKQQKYSSICRNHFIHKKTQIEKEQYCGFDNISLSVEYMTVHFCVFISASEKYCLPGYFHPVKFSPVYICKIFRPVFNSLR